MGARSGESRDWRGALLVVPLSCYVGVAGAQEVPEFRPGRVKELYPKERVQRDDGRRYLLPYKSGEEVPPDAGTFSFVLRDLRVEGATVYGADDLRRLYAGKLGTRITLAEVYGIARAITGKYRDDGHSRAVALVPGQPFRRGVAVIIVEEGP